MRVVVAAAVLALLATVLPTVAVATSTRQMTFTGIPGDTIGTGVWIEDGITATGEIASFTEPDAVHLDTNATSYSSSLAFTTGSLFNALSLDIHAFSTNYCSATIEADCFTDCPPCASFFDDPYPYILIRGFADDEMVSSLGIYRPSSSVFETLLLGNEFAGIDRLVVAVRTPQSLGLPGFCGAAQPCAHFDVDNIVLQLIPEPTAALLLGLGLAGLAATKGGADSGDSCKGEKVLT